MTTTFSTFHITTNTADDVVTGVMNALSYTGMAAFMTGHVSPMLAARGGERFATEGDAAVGGTWAPLAEATVAYREEEGFGGEHPINVRTGEMESWVTNPAPGLAPISFGGDAGIGMDWPSPEPDGEIGDKVRYAQTGVGPETSSVARPILGVDESDLLATMSSLLFYIMSNSKANIL